MRLRRAKKGFPKGMGTKHQKEENQYYYSEDPIQCQYGFLPTQLYFFNQKPNFHFLNFFKNPKGGPLALKTPLPPRFFNAKGPPFRFLKKLRKWKLGFWLKEI